MKMGYFHRKQYDPYKENTVHSTSWKDREVRKMTPWGDHNQFHILIDGMCPGSVWPYRYGIQLEGNKTWISEKATKVLGMQKIVSQDQKVTRDKKIFLLFTYKFNYLFPSKHPIGLLHFSSYLLK